MKNKQCPVCHTEQEEWRVICKGKGCVYVFLADNPIVASIRVTYPVGSRPEYDDK